MTIEIAMYLVRSKHKYARTDEIEAWLDAAKRL
jgi:hypothetical protein